MDSLWDDSKNWLAEFNYSVHNHSDDRKNITFSCFDTDLENFAYFPAIAVWEKEDGERGCQITYAGLKMFLSLQSGKLQYRHPDIIKYLTVFINYAKAMEAINPFYN